MILFITFLFHTAQGWLSLFIHDHYGCTLISPSIIKDNKNKSTKAPALHNLLKIT